MCVCLVYAWCMCDVCVVCVWCMCGPVGGTCDGLRVSGDVVYYEGSCIMCCPYYGCLSGFSVFSL